MQDLTYNSFNNNINEPETPTNKTSREKQKNYKLILRKKNINDTSPEIMNISDINSDNILLCNLSHNNLTILPENLKLLKNLISLDIRKNSFKDINNIIDYISQYKYLTDLKIDFTI